MADEYYEEKLADAQQRIPDLEHMLGSGLFQPFNNTNSGARKILFNTQHSQIFPLIGGEKAIIETGYEIRYGDYSSSVTSADSDYVVVGKISKFSFSPNHHYYLIMKDVRNKRLDVAERIAYQYITESYGYLYNNTYADSLEVGSYVPQGTVIQKSLAFDEYNNRKDGVNLNMAYLALDQNMEDSVVISDVAAAKMTSPLIQPVTIMINENNIPLNLYGDKDHYKCIPDIGEEIKNSVLIALRKEKKEEMVFTESVDRLQKPMMSDDKKLLAGRVIDINIYCNNPENLNGYHDKQFKMYYDENRRMSQEFVSMIAPFVLEGYEISYDLKELYARAKRVLNGDKYIDKKPFSNIVLDIVVVKDLPLQVGDKISNRYGGKGVISKILPQKFMPKFGDSEYADVIFNSSTMYNRENPGQMFESSLTYIGSEIIKHIRSSKCSINEAFDMILKYIDHIVPEEAKVMKELIDGLDEHERQFFLQSFLIDGSIHISTKPIADSFDIYKLMALYDKFPWIDQQEVYVPIRDSNGNYRYVKARRKIVIGREYIFRLKQFAEEKFSVTSLSSTNIKGNNTKSKANKNYNDMYSNTPIRFGNMEINNMNHLGVEEVTANLMIHSTSPHGRRLAEQMYECNPYHVNIRLDGEAKNREAEILNTYLKTIGKRLVFRKIKKHRVKMAISPIYFDHSTVVTPVMFHNDENFDEEKYFKEKAELENRKRTDPKLVKPVRFYGIDHKRREMQNRENELAIQQKNIKDIRQWVEPE